MNRRKQIVEGIFGAIAGFVLGTIGQVLLGLNENLEGNRRFPTEGALIGTMAGILFGFILGSVRIKGRIKHGCVGAACGAIIGILLGWFAGSVWPATDSKERAAFIGTGVILGAPIFASIGLVLGLLRRNISQAVDPQV